MNQLTICTVAQRLDSWLCQASSHKLTRSHGFNPKEDPFLLTEAYQGDAFDSEIVPGGDEGEQNNGAKEQGGSGKSKRPKRRPNRASGIAEPEGKRPKRGPNSNQSLSLDQGPNSDLGTATSTCPCCGQFHRLARCFYVFSRTSP